ncbi:Aste57867_16143 [Aphanomyces stellatus]|uniref:Aste57867_16143 protein n=1 Tax=Aphanomyces stellatus TaxID=120398 RepID=A0A485L4R9_9STRA|nr:hypothetical protein As57867_016087 [Aphanomyces stellatus]VFT92923.1 Aste57867_16143 [Aphanomyces stellatus]
MAAPDRGSAYPLVESIGIADAVVTEPSISISEHEHVELGNLPSLVTTDSNVYDQAATEVAADGTANSNEGGDLNSEATEGSSRKPMNETTDDKIPEKSLVELIEAGEFDTVKEKLRWSTVPAEVFRTQNEAGESLLDVAVRSKNTGVVKSLISQSNCKSTPNWQSSPLRRAIEMQSKEICEVFLDKWGTDIDVKYTCKERGYSLLHYAVKFEMESVIKGLLKEKSDVNQPNNEHQTPLMMAVSTRNARILELLLQSNAEVNFRNVKSQSALDIAVEINWSDGIHLLCLARATLDGNPKNLTNAAIQAERLFQARYPVHQMARDGDIERLQTWLSDTTAIGFGQHFHRCSERQEWPS